MESTSPAQLDTVSQPEAPAASRYSLRWLFFPLALLYHELLLRAFDSSTVFFDAALVPTALTALGLGLLISLLANALPCRRVSRWAALILTLLWTVCVCVEYCCKSYFKSYFALTFMVTMTGHVVGDFAGTIPDVVLPRLPFILLALVPPVLAIVLRRRIVPEDSMGRRGLLVLALLALLTLGGGDAVGRFGPSAALFTYDFNTNSAVPRFGLNTALRLELTYAVTGVPTPPLEPLPEPDPAPEPEPTPVDYGYNMLDIDFTALAESTGDSTLASLHRYMAARTPLPPEPVYRHVRRQEPDPADGRVLLALVHLSGADPHPVPPDPRGLRVQQLLPARLGPVHHRRRVCRPHRPAAHMGGRRCQLLGQPL